jgi:hypothetical protein
MIDEASGNLLLLRARTKKNRTIQKRKDENTHHTPTQEYVVPKSIPIAGPSDLDIFFFYM